MMLLTRMPLVLLLAFSSAACNVTKWSIIGDEFNLEHEICKEIPKNGALKIAVPTGFDLSNSSIIKQFPEGWTLTESGTRQIKLKTSKTTSANTLIEITLSEAKAPAHYIVPFDEEFTEFSVVVSKGGFDCAKCTAATVTPAAPVLLQPIVAVLLQLKSQSSTLIGTWASLTSDTQDADVEGLKLEGVTILNDTLTQLSLDTKKLTGTIPDFSKNVKLTHLYLSNNKFTGTIPSFSSNTALQYLYLDESGALTDTADWKADTSNYPPGCAPSNYPPGCCVVEV